MKELSIEQKAQRYDEAIERAKNIYGASECKDILYTLETIFPELKESVDESVRKWIIKQIKTYDPSNIKEEALAWLERMGGSKETHDENSEPKFKVGDLVVNKFGDVWHIDSFDKKNYQVSNGNEYNYFPISKQDEMHLWTIRDAKDGDVLAFDNETIVIFKDLYNSSSFHSYCHIEDGIFDISKDELPDWWESVGFHPATKEQCNLLFQKMKEAGYEWDADKKKLKEIEQTPAWSEDDKNRINRLILYFEDKESFTAEDDVVYANWLKSLKDRVQPKQEWSEEDNSNLQCCIAKVQHDMNNGWIGRNRELLSWLESLKNRYTWKPSVGQIEVLKLASGYLSEKCNRDLADSLYNDLKKLRGE